MENVELRKEKYWKDVFKSGNELGVSDIYDRRLYDSSRAKRVAMNEAFENKKQIRGTNPHLLYQYSKFYP